MCELVKRINQMMKRVKLNVSDLDCYNDTYMNFTDRNITINSTDECHYFVLIDVFNKYYIPFIVLFGLVGNFLSCMVFLNSHLRMRSSSYYLAALSLADFGFLVSLLFVWLNDSTGLQTFNNDGWCQGVVYTSSVCSFLSVWLIVAFTLERLIAVQYPLQRPQVCTVSRAKAVIAVLTVLALVTHSYSFFTAGMIVVGGEKICDMKEHYAELMRVTNMIDSFLTLVLPLILITLMNSMITWNLVKFNRRFTSDETLERNQSDFNLQQRTRSNSPQCQTPQPGSGNAPKRQVFTFSRCQSVVSFRNPVTARAQQNITKMLLLISSVFILLNLPSYAVRVYVFIFYAIWRQSTPVRLWCLQQLFMLLFYTNFSINFLLYSMYGMTFRKCLWQMLQKNFRFLKRFR